MRPSPLIEHFDSLHSSADLNDNLASHGLELDPEHPDHVRWAQDGTSHPRQWRTYRKIYNLSFIMLYEAFEASLSTLGAAAAIQARTELGYSPTMSYFAFTGTFVVGEGISGLFFPPLSEAFGRKLQYVVSPALVCIFSVLSTVHSLPAIAVFRLLAGIAGGVPPSISLGSIEDIFCRKDQVWAIFSWATASNVGLVVGPIASSYLIDRLSWEWVFYISGVTAFIMFCMSLFFFESRPNLLLSRSLQKLHKETGFTTLKITNPDHHPTWRGLVTETLTRPMRLLLTEPIIVIAAMLNSLAFALIYCLTEALPIVYTSFGFDIAATSLAFIPALIGVLFSAILRLVDYRRLCRLEKANVNLQPEHKIKSLLFSSPALLVGLWVFAWTIPPGVPNVHYLVSMAALVPVGLAANDFDSVIAGYLVDVYGSYAASAFASVTWARATASLVFTLATDAMFRGLDANVASSVLGGGALFVCVGAIGLWCLGPWLRRRSKFAGEWVYQTEEDYTGGQSTTI